MFLACAPGHRLAGSESVSLTELAAERFVDMPEGWGVRMAADRAFAAAGIARTVSFELNDSASVIDFVREGLRRRAPTRTDGGDRARGPPDPDRRRGAELRHLPGRADRPTANRRGDGARGRDPRPVLNATTRDRN